MVEEQAKKQIMKNSKNVCQNMKLEGQELDESRMQDFIEVQAEEILQAGKADLIFIGREMLRNPYFAILEVDKLECESEWPKQYRRGRP